MGEGSWARQLEEKHSELANPAKEEPIKNIAQVSCLAIVAEDTIV